MQAERLVILTGAGISAESGISTFRDEGGLWCQHRIEDVATPEGFARNPALVQNFYNMRRRQLRDVEPNAAHVALARLEAEWPGDILLVTQNVDDLHTRAGCGKRVNVDGSPTLIAMHGELLKARCINTDTVQDWPGDIDETAVCGCCGSTGTLRPHIVWFGEMPLMMEAIYDALSRCDVFVSIGTSGQVYPAAGFVQAALMAGAHTLELNLEPSDGYGFFAESRQGKAGELVPAWVEEMLAGHFSYAASNSSI